MRIQIADSLDERLLAAAKRLKKQPGAVVSDILRRELPDEVLTIQAAPEGGRDAQ